MVKNDKSKKTMNDREQQTEEQRITLTQNNSGR